MSGFAKHFIINGANGMNAQTSKRSLQEEYDFKLTQARWAFQSCLGHDIRERHLARFGPQFPNSTQCLRHSLSRTGFVFWESDSAFQFSFYNPEVYLSSKYQMKEYSRGFIDLEFYWFTLLVCPIYVQIYVKITSLCDISLGGFKTMFSKKEISS